MNYSNLFQPKLVSSAASAKWRTSSESCAKAPAQIDNIINQRCRMNPPQGACKVIAHQRTISTAPFSLGSQPQNRPHDWSAQIPPSTVPTKLKSVAKQTTP